MITGTELLRNALNELHSDAEKKNKGWLERQLTETYSAESQDTVDYKQFIEILQSSSVCAWGECYHSTIHHGHP
jgi:hypothetical protein